MKRYAVRLEKQEREELDAMTRKGFHPSQKVINVLILLNCDEGECNEHQARGEGGVGQWRCVPNDSRLAVPRRETTRRTTGA